MRRRSGTPSIHDIAAEAGVSSATVSRVLNDGVVSAQTRQKVERVVRHLGYQPDLHAATLRTGRTRRMGLVIPDIANPAYALTARLVYDHLRPRKYSLAFGITYGSLEEEVRALEMLQRERVAGVLLNTSEGESDEGAVDTFRRLIDAGVHFVFAGREAFSLPVEVLSVDNEAGVSKAVEYLARTGRTRIGFLAGEGGTMATRGRLAGYRSGLKACRIKAPAGAVVCKGGYTLENGEQLALAALRAREVDALVCGNDLMALGACRAAERLHLRVPRDVAVVGFDDIPLASLVRPRLTTVRQPFDRIASTACDLLVGRAEGTLEEAPRTRVFETELVVRESA